MHEYLCDCGHALEINDAAQGVIEAGQGAMLFCPECRALTPIGSDFHQRPSRSPEEHLVISNDPTGRQLVRIIWPSFDIS